MSLARLTVSVLGLFGCAIGFAGPTGLNFIPTADFLGHREVYFEYSYASNEKNIDPTIYHCGALQAGLWDRIEFGIDLGFDPKYHEIWNAKVKVAESKDGKAALAAGLWNCDEDYVEPYAVGMVDLGWSRVHLGATHGKATHLLAGLDRSLGRSFTAMADYMSGSSEQLWFGVGFDHPAVDGLSITFSVGVPLNSSQGLQSVLAVGYARKF